MLFLSGLQVRLSMIRLDSVSILALEFVHINSSPLPVAPQLIRRAVIAKDDEESDEDEETTPAKGLCYNFL